MPSNSADAAATREHAARLEAEAQVRELTLAREAMAEQRAQLRLITDAVPGSSPWWARTSSTASSTRPTAPGSPGSPETLIGHSLPEVMGPSEYETVREHVERALGGADVKY